MSSSARRASPVAIACVVALGAAVAGCGLVVGSGDYVVGNVPEAGPEGTSDDAAGPDARPTPAVDGAAPESDATSAPDTSGPIPEAGTTTEGGSTAVCGPGGVLVQGGLPTGDSRFQQLVDACVLAVSCDPLFFDVTVSECITDDYLDTYPTKCLASIKSCDDYYACMGSRIATLAECHAAATADTGSCNGQVATSCFAGGDGIISNCVTLGGTCAVYHESDYADFGDVAAGCKIGNCAGPTDGSHYCLAPSQVYTCDETDVTATNVGISRQACPVGSACQKSSAGGECLSTTTSCPTPGTSCVNGKLTTCVSLASGNQQYASDCSAAGLSCSTNVSGVSACTAAGCANSGCTETCTGKSLQACIGGAPYVIDCAALGFNTCDTASNDNTGVAFAFCAYQ